MSMKDEVKQLWQLCFDDSIEFTDLYFDQRYKDELNVAIREDNKMIAALQMIPYPMTFCNETIATSYISGACTHPDYRNHGAMRRLLKETHRRMFQNGVLLSTLIPAEEWLVAYYAKSGYALSFGYAAQTMKVEELRPDSAYTISVCRSPESEYYHYFDACMRGRKCCIQHLKEDFLVILADLKLSGGQLLVARHVDRIVGMAFIVMEEDVLYIKELLADNEEVKDSLLNEAAHIYKVREVVYLLPSSSDTLFMGMARVIQAEKMLSLFAKKYPASELYIHIEEDDVIPENNGYYTLCKGECRRERLSDKKYHTYDIAHFTRLLLEAEYPFMSLMLN